MDASALVAYGDNPADANRRRRLSELIARRRAGEPIAYIIGGKEFYGLRLRADRRALIPRPETEELVERVVADWRGADAKILDLGTGSGAIACAIAHALPDSRVVATDISTQALELARENAEMFGLAERIDFRVGDLFDALGEALRFDAIVANLPYVGGADGRFVDDAVRKFEPREALDGGEDGLDVYRRMMPAAGNHLGAVGAIYMECSQFNANALAEMTREAFPTAAVEIVRDLAGHERMVIARLGSGRT